MDCDICQEGLLPRGWPYKAKMLCYSCLIVEIKKEDEVKREE